MNTKLFLETLDQLQTRQIEECVFEANGKTWKLLYNEDAEEFYLSYLFRIRYTRHFSKPVKEWNSVLTINAGLNDMAIVAIATTAILAVK